MLLKVFLVVLSCAVSLVADDWNRVYLASFPRSGNHWVRYLVEDVTQVATGSVYPDQDPPHLLAPFAWGGYAANRGYLGNCRFPTRQDVILVKTHFPAAKKTKYDLLPAVKTVRIVRHPIDALYSEYRFAYKGNPPTTTMSTDRLTMLIRYWRRFQEYWNKRENVVTVRYEDLYSYPKETLKEILEAMGVQAEEEAIDRAISKHGPEGTLLKSLSYYTPEQVQLIRDSLKDLLQMYGYSL